MEIVSGRVSLSDRSVARVSGFAEMVPDGKLELSADIPPVLLKNILPVIWGDRVAGQFESTGAKWLSQFKSGPPAEFSGPFRGHGMVLSGIPFIDKIANLLRKPQLVLMEFLDFKGNFSWTAQRTRVSDIFAESQDGMLRLKGEVEVTPGVSVRGKLKIEASDVYFAGFPGGPPPVFKPSEEGWLAVEFELSGREEAVMDSIPVNAPVIIERAVENTSKTLPKMSLQTPAPFSSPQAAPAPAAAPLPPSVAPRQKSPAELEREFNELLGR